MASSASLLDAAAAATHRADLLVRRHVGATGETDSAIRLRIGISDAADHLDEFTFPASSDHFMLELC